MCIRDRFQTLDPATNFIAVTDEAYMEPVFDEFKSTVMVGDDVYGIPTAASQGAVFLYNEPIFEENGYEVPEDWESLMALCCLLYTSTYARLKLFYRDKMIFYIGNRSEGGTLVRIGVSIQRERFVNEKSD